MPCESVLILCTCDRIRAVVGFETDFGVDGEAKSGIPLVRLGSSSSNMPGKHTLDRLQRFARTLGIRN